MNFDKTFKLTATTSKGNCPVTVKLTRTDNGTRYSGKWKTDIYITIEGKNYKCREFSAHVIKSDSAGLAFGRNETVKIRLTGKGFRDMDRYKNACDREFADSFNNTNNKKADYKTPYTQNWWASGMNGE